ncbi:HNH endonuclease signature motif containing protein [Nocardioides cheoyonin]|uniref:HNH endonuclease signature motif containing protein n=1 Tax=Nocardioides cheoyonin TaxID=3156615 RepID=UPI0032B4BA82
MAELTPVPAVLASVRHARREIARAAHLTGLFPRPDEVEATLRELAALEAQTTALRLRLMASAGPVAASTGARDVGAWWADALRADHRAARADLKLARALDRYEVLAAALAEGTVSVEQARVIARALDALPDDLAPGEVSKAEAVMVDEAARLDPARLRTVGAHLLEVLDPQRAEEVLGKRLLAEEERANRRTSLTITDPGDGTMFLRARLPRATGVRLRTYLDAFTQPRLAQLAERGKTIPYDRLLGHAFGQLLERIDPDTLPHHGGDATTLIVTIPVDQLNSELGSASIGSDGEISAAEARRLACTAGIIPAVLDTHSEVLDLGRKTRLFTPAQRKALRIRYPTCAVEGCEVPAPWTDAHHLHPWALGGLSDLSNAVLFCRHHHRLAHNPAYAPTRHPDGSIRFHRRT